MAEPPAGIVASACAMELMRVETADGRYLGRVYDLRCRWDADRPDAPVVDEIAFARTGLLERVGLRHVKPRSVHWYLVEAIRGNVIVVSADKR
jgi:sporulation protein YlmC with PRC-barrel domain